VALVVLGALIGFVLCSDLVVWPIYIKLRLIQICASLALIGWFSFTVFFRIIDAVSAWLLIGFLCIWPVTMVITGNSTYVWISLFLICILAVINIIIKLAGTAGSWKYLQFSAYAVWIATGAFVTAGSTSYFPYALPIISFARGRFLLDIRTLITIVFLSIYAGEAIWKVFHTRRPAPPNLPVLTIPEVSSTIHSLIRSFLQPIFIVTNMILIILHRIINIIWMVLASLVIYLFLTGVVLTDRIIRTITDKEVNLPLFQIISFSLIIIFFTRLAGSTSNSFYFYLTSSSVSISNTIALFYVAGLFLIANMAMVFLGVFFDYGQDGLSRVLFFGTMFVLICLFSGLLIYAISRIDSLGIRGFDSPGLFSILSLMIIACAIVVGLSRRFIESKAST